MKKITFILILSVLFSVNHSFGQTNNTTETLLFGKNKTTKAGTFIRCASTEYEEYLKSKSPNRLTTSEFEQWINPKIALEKEKRKNQSAVSKENAVITIPVVVHVIHNGDAYGASENIFDEQVISQIQVLNEDFRRKVGTPGFNNNPVGADVEVEFALAKRDPSGVLSNGIDRVNLGQASWSTDEIESNVKPLTQWDPTKYFNIWVVKLASNTLLGYAQFPSASGLSGINTNSGNANTDGVVIGYAFFGSSTYFPGGTYVNSYDKGRTTSHEVGHWLGLRHIWGDGDCTVDDFCADTPNAGQENQGCPAGADSCPDSDGLDMIENYMDYTDDACMNIFTNDQKNRIVTVLNNATRRVSLKNSDALNPGVVLANDASSMIINLNINCSKTFAPTIEITNKGSNTLTQATVEYSIDNQNVQTYTWTGSLATNQSQNVTLPGLTTTAANHNFNCTIKTVNGTTDQNAANNSSTVNFDIVNTVNYASNQFIFSLQLDHYGSETTWKLTSSAGVKVYESEPYADTGDEAGPLPAVISQTFDLPNSDCYTFSIADGAGDGICCDFGQGSYSLKTAAGAVVASGGEFEYGESTKFSNNSLATTDVVDAGLIYLYPNPTANQLQIIVDNKVNTPEAYTIINSLGQVVKSNKIESIEDLSVNVSTLSQGIYFLKLSSSQSKTTTLRFVKK
jgi:hypothetical protein